MASNEPNFCPDAGPLRAKRAQRGGEAHQEVGGARGIEGGGVAAAGRLQQRHGIDGDLSPAAEQGNIFSFLTNKLSRVVTFNMQVV